MGRAGKRAGTARQLSVQYFPLLPKPASAAGKFVDVPGKFWEGCPAADKAKIFKCIMVEFKAIHDFGGGRKGAGYLMKEMGESGADSLEPGVASGAEFVMGYPTPFLEYYWSANRGELEPDVRARLFPTELATIDEEGKDEAVGAAAPAVAVKAEKEKVPIFQHLELVTSTLNTAGPRRGDSSDWTAEYMETRIVLASRTH